MYWYFNFQDEVYERDRFSDFFFIVIRDELFKYLYMKFILMSVLMNVDLFIRYFNNCFVLRCKFKYFYEDFFIILNFFLFSMIYMYIYVIQVNLWYFI